MAQEFGRRSLTVEAPVGFRVSPCGICVGQIGTGTGFSLSSLVIPCKYNFTMAVHSHISRGDER
jgi:hypothetical protein